jgi:hypothetical protein
MNNAPESEEDLLLKAALDDDEWQTLSRTLKSRSLRAFRHRRNLRRCVRGGIVCMVLLAVVLEAPRFQRTSQIRPLSPASQPVMAAAKPLPPEIPRLSDQELLALFPKGSCAIADLDGRKQLIFFDRKQAGQDFALEGR